jgi:hypothetical protein
VRTDLPTTPYSFGILEKKMGEPPIFHFHRRLALTPKSLEFSL